MDASRWMLRAPRVRKSSTTCLTLAISGTRSSSSRRNDGAAWLRRRRQRLPCPPIPAESKDPRRPLALLGFMGSGKTLVGALVAQRGRAAFFDLDHLVEDMFDLRRPRYEQADHRVDGTREAGAVADEVLKLWSG